MNSVAFAQQSGQARCLHNQRMERAATAAIRSSVAAPAASPHRLSSCRSLVILNAGFGQENTKSEPKKSKDQPRIARFLGTDKRTSTPSDADGWFEIPDVDFTETFNSKPVKAVILATGRALCLYKVGEEIFCSDANSTAFKYPLADSNLLQLKTGPAVETKLDGTVYDLRTGKVMSWCPKNNPLRAVLGSLKDKSEPEDLPVHPVRVDGGRTIMVKLVK